MDEQRSYSGVGIVMMLLLLAVVLGAVLPKAGGDRTSTNTETTTTRTETDVLSRNKMFSDIVPQMNLLSTVHNYFIYGENAKGTETTTDTSVNTAETRTEVNGDRNNLVPGTNFPMRSVWPDGTERCWDGEAYTTEACK